jgi:hypothetical protein
MLSREVAELQGRLGCGKGVGTGELSESSNRATPTYYAIHMFATNLLDFST